MLDILLKQSSIKARYLLFQGICFFLHFKPVSHPFVCLMSIPKWLVFCVMLGFITVKKYFARIYFYLFIRNCGIFFLYHSSFLISCLLYFVFLIVMYVFIVLVLLDQSINVLVMQVVANVSCLIIPLLIIDIAQYVKNLKTFFFIFQDFIAK